MDQFNHVGITVSNLQRSLDFYTKVLGLPDPKPGWVHSIEGPWLGKLVGGTPNTKINIAFIPLDHGILELLEYAEPEMTTTKQTLKNWDVGSMHVCLNVKDVHKFYEENKDSVDFFTEPQQVVGGPFAGAWVTYLRDPDGISVELVQRDN